MNFKTPYPKPHPLNPDFPQHSLNPKPHTLNPILGFTFIEIMVALGISIIIGTFALVFLNAPKQLERSRNTKRTADVNVIMNAIGQNMADNRGIFTCASGSLGASSTRMAIGAGNYDIAPCLAPTYLVSLPYDPNAYNAHWTSVTDYDTAYGVSKNAATGRITISVIYPESGETISVTR